MGITVRVYVSDDWVGTKRREVQAEIVKSRPTTIHVRLPDGRVVKRKRKRDLV